MGRLFVISLDGKIYSCKHCRAHLAITESIISKAFHCKHGKAYLFNKVMLRRMPMLILVVGIVNVTVGTKEDRLMTTGMHTVSDVFCVGCGSIVGWKYEAAHEKPQKYKEGKVVLERYKLIGPDGSQYWMAHGAHVGGSDADDA